MYDLVPEDFSWELTDIRFGKTHMVTGWAQLNRAIKEISSGEVAFWVVRLVGSSVTVPLERVMGRERRQHPRFAKSTKIKLVEAGRHFVASSLDISVAGIRIAGPIPEYVLQANTIFIFQDGTKFPPFIMKYQVIENSPAGCRLKFLDNNVIPMRYLSWVKSTGESSVNLNATDAAQSALLFPIK